MQQVLSRCAPRRARGETAAQEFFHRPMLPSTLEHDLLGGIRSLLRSNTCADLFLSLGAERAAIPVHTLVLHLRCPRLLQELLDGTIALPQPAAASVRHAVLPAALSPSTAEALLEYAYADQLNAAMSEAQVCDLFRMGERYSLPRLQQQCEHRLQLEMSPATAARRLTLALDIGANRLADFARQYCFDHFDAVVRSPDFATLPARLGASLFEARYARPLVQAIRCAATSEALIEELVVSGGLGVLGPPPPPADDVIGDVRALGEVLGDAEPSGARRAGGVPDGSDDDGSQCSALEATLFLNPSSEPRWAVADLLVRLHSRLRAEEGPPLVGGGQGAEYRVQEEAPPMGGGRGAHGLGILATSGVEPGASVLHALVRRAHAVPSCEQILRWLKSHQIDPNATDALGCTAVDVAYRVPGLQRGAAGGGTALLCTLLLGLTGPWSEPHGGTGIPWPCSLASLDHLTASPRSQPQPL